MIKNLWSVPLITAYIYAVTVISNIGFTGYFDIPMQYIGASIKSNIVFVKMLLDALVAFVGFPYPHFFLWLPLLIVTFLFARKWKWWPHVGLTVLLLFLLFGASRLGRFVAERQVTYVVPSAECERYNDGTYIIITANEGVFAMVKLEGNKKIKRGSFWAVSMSDMSCELIYKDVGPLR